MSTRLDLSNNILISSNLNCFEINPISFAAIRKRNYFLMQHLNIFGFVLTLYK